jgi:ethanolamine transporter EutH
MNDVAAAGMVATLANNIPMFAMMKDMDDRGKVLNCAFAVSAAFTFGDHLGFTAGVEPQLIFAMIVGKLVAGVTAVGVATLFAPKAVKAPEPVVQVEPRLSDDYPRMEMIEIKKLSRTCREENTIWQVYK